MAWASGQIGLFVEQYVPYIHAWSGNPCLDPVNPAYYPAPMYNPAGFQIGGSGFKFVTFYDYRSTTPTGLLIAGSNDFVNWTPLNGDKAVSGILGSARHTKVCPSGASGYMLYYWDSTLIYTPAAIRRALSYDLLNWFNDTPLASGGSRAWVTGIGTDWNYGTYGPIHIIYNSGAINSGTNPFDYSVVMYHDAATGASQQIALSYSKDGITFELFDLVLPRGVTSGVWDQNYTTAAAIVSGTNGWLCFYGGGIGAANEAVGMARSMDGIHWTKSRANPVITRASGTWTHARAYAVGAVIDSSGHFNGAGEPVDVKFLVSGRNSGSNYSVGAFFYNDSYHQGTTTCFISGKDKSIATLDSYGDGYSNISGSMTLFTEFNYPKVSGGLDAFIWSEATPVIWSGSTVSGILSQINDGDEHFVLLDIQASGANNWSLSISLDGQDFVTCGPPDTGNIGAIPSGDIAQVCLTPQSRIIPDGQYVDEVCLHSDGSVPTQIERERLFQLGDRLDLPLSMYNYSTVKASGYATLVIHGYALASGAMGLSTEWGGRGRMPMFIGNRGSHGTALSLSIPYFTPASGLPSSESVVYHHPCNTLHEVVGDQNWTPTDVTFVATSEGSGLASQSMLFGSGTSYPSVSGHTNLTWFMRLQNPATLHTGRGYTFGIDPSGFIFGNAVWSGASISAMKAEMGDGRSHALMVNLRHFAGSQWLLRTSIDGRPYTDQGTQNTGTQDIISIDANPFLLVASGTGDAVDDVVMWAGASIDPSTMYSASGLYATTPLYLSGSGGGVADVFSIESLMRSADHSPQLVGRFKTAPTGPVTIELWECVSGVATPLSMASNLCYAIGDTGRWAWSTANLPPLTRTASQYTYRMTDAVGEVFQGHFTLRAPMISRTRMPRGSAQADVLRRPR